MAKNDIPFSIHAFQASVLPQLKDILVVIHTTLPVVFTTCELWGNHLPQPYVQET